MSGVGRVVRPIVQRLGLMPLYFRAAEWRLSRRFPRPPAADADGVPIPPRYLMTLVIGTGDWRGFLHTGETTARALAGYAAEAGAPFENAGRILDLGCGCGRVVRHLPKLTQAELFGVDVNPLLAGWCAKNLKGTFDRNALVPPLDFPDGHFGAVYLLSVFTHLRIETQRVWLKELRRVTRPGGVVLLTFHDEGHAGLPQSDAAQAALARDGAYIYNDEAEGSNLIASFQTMAFSRRLFAEDFEPVTILAGNENPIGQALAVLRRPA